MNKRRQVLLAMVLITMYVFIGCKGDVNSKKSITSNETIQNAMENTQKEVIKDGKEYYGKWLVESDITPDGIPTIYGNEDVEKIIGKKVSFSEDTAVYDGIILENPVYDETIISGSDITYMLVTTYGALGLDENNPPKMVTIFAPRENREPWDSMISTFFVKNKNTLIVFKSGLFIKLVRVTDDGYTDN